MTKFNSLNTGDIRAGTYVIAGELRVVASGGDGTSTINGPVSSLTVSNLDGNTDEEYRVIVRAVSAVSGTNRFFVRPNNIGDSSKFGQQAMAGSNTTSVAWRSTGDADNTGFQIGRCNTVNTIAFGECNIRAKTGYVRSAITQFAQEISGTTVSVVQKMGISWNDTSTNITSLVVASEQTNGLGVGTHIIILKKVTSLISLGGFNSVSVPMGKLTAGVFETVKEGILSVDSTTITLDGLDGDSDVLYELEYRIVNGYSGTSWYSQTFNTDTGSNYGCQRLCGFGSAVHVTREALASFGESSAGYSLLDVCQAKFLIFAKSGFVRSGISQITRGVLGTTVTSNYIEGLSWNNTSDNITQIVITGNPSSCLKENTYYRLKALKRKV